MFFKCNLGVLSVCVKEYEYERMGICVSVSICKGMSMSVCVWPCVCEPACL